ncbi:MAG: alpha/beta hydrolase [Acidobacteria bacterium]|nr:alpha/beta hydrolase [Acidobacteriota bacterium]
MRNKTLRRLAEAATGPLIVSGLALLALDVARRVFRHTQLFCPSPDPVSGWNPDAYGIPRARVEEHWMETDDGELLYGWYCHAKKPAIASALFCHGNTGNLTTIAGVIPHLLDSGINVLLFDYRGFGKSTGRPSLSGVVSDGVCAARYHDRIRPKDRPSILYGYSLGGAIAAQVTKLHNFDGLILQSTFTNLSDLARVTFPRVPLHLVAGNFFDTMRIVRRLEIPVLFMHGTADETIPYWMTQRLYDACPSRKELRIVEGGLHKDLYVRDGDVLVWAVNRFATELGPRTHRKAPRPPVFDQLVDTAFRYVRRQLRARSVHGTL